MSSITSSPRRIEKVSSDNIVIGFDLLSNLTYMWVLSLGGLPRDQVLENCSRQRLKTAVFFDYIYTLAKRLGLEYTQAFQIVSEKAKASNVKSLLLRFAASISSGESERDFIAEEARIEGERYANEYERSVENLRKWTDAYAAIMVSVTLIMVVSLVSTMMGSLSQNFIVIMALTLLFITSIGVYVIYKVAPVEQMTYDTRQGTTRERRMARFLLLTLAPMGVILALLLGPQLDLLVGFSVGFLLIGASLLPAGFYAWKDDANMTKLDSEFPIFLRSVGNVAGAAGVTLTESLRRIDTRSLGSLEPYISRLRVRLGARLPTRECWEKFREETGSELVNRTTHMLVDGSELGGTPDRVGMICSEYAQRVVQLRAKRRLTASTFSFLSVPMHATMSFILLFVLGIITNFSSKLAEASGSVLQTADHKLPIPENFQLPPGVSVPTARELGAGLDIFGTQDMALVSYMIILVIIILTVANSLAPKFAAGGSNLKIVSFLSMMCIVSGAILGIVPLLTSALFSI